jgi:hypothetical protein
MTRKRIEAFSFHIQQITWVKITCLVENIKSEYIYIPQKLESECPYLNKNAKAIKTL